jgi:subtilase family serine protease
MTIPHGVVLGSSLGSHANVAGSLSFAETNAELASEVATAVNDPSSPSYHHYMHGTQFQDLFGPNPVQQSRLQAYLESYGITVSAVSPFLWNVRGTAAAMDAAFDTTFVSAVAQDGNHGYAPLTPMKLPSDLAAGVSVTGAFQNAAHDVHPENRMPNLGERHQVNVASRSISPAPAGTIALNITNQFDAYNWPISSTTTLPVLVIAPSGLNETYNLTITGGSAPYAVNWSWGDGTDQVFSTSSNTVALFHNYPFPGQTNYCFANFTVACINITLSVTDGALDSGGLTVPIVPVASPHTVQTFYDTVTLYRLGDTGQGTSIGLDEMCDPYYPTADYLTDINHFSAAFGLPLLNSTTLQLVGSGNSDDNCANNGGGSGNWSGETLLDMEWSHSLAPNASLVVDLSASAMQEGDSAWDNLASGVFVDSNSWGCYYTGQYGCDYDWTPWEQAAAQGQSFLTASGDCGAAGMNGTDPPTDTSFGVGVGGTDILPYPSGVFKAEFAWNGTDDTNCVVDGTNDAGSTGGYASNWGQSNASAIPAPWYQTGTPGFVNPYRGVPDVSAIGGTWVAQYQAIYNGWFPDAGTSLSSPSWAGMLDLMYVYNGTTSHTNGFANKDLYNIAKSANYLTGFHDITVGNNFVQGPGANYGPCPICYNDTPGWDAVTGLGSADVGKLAMLISAQNGNPDAIGPLTVVLSANVTYGPAALSVNFGADVTGGPISLSGYSYDWRFGDDTSTYSSTIDVSHTYSSGGIFYATVSVTAGSFSGLSNTVIIHVTGANTIGPTLASVSVSPSSVKLTTNLSQTFSTSAFCSGGTCPSSGFTYSWTMTQALGTLNTTSGPVVGFTAGHTSGTIALFVNTTLNGNTVEGNPAFITMGNALRAVVITPTFANVTPNGTQLFSVSPVCTMGNCSSGTLYSWSLSSSALGSLNASTGGQVSFTAHSAQGTEMLFVNGTLQGVTRMSSPATIVIAPLLSSVSITPLTANVTFTNTATFSATISCAGGVCPPGTTYLWSYPNNLGSLNTTTGNSVTFTAGSTAGKGNITVTATLRGKIVYSSVAVVNVKSPPYSFDWSVLVPAIVLLAAAAVAIILVIRSVRKDKGSSKTYTPPPPT